VEIKVEEDFKQMSVDANLSAIKYFAFFTFCFLENSLKIKIKDPLHIE
jgi:hypothetical protein